MGKTYQAGDLWRGQGSPRTMQLLARRGLAVYALHHGQYLLPTGPLVQSLVAGVRAGDREAAMVLSDYLQDRGVPRPLELLALLSGEVPTKSMRREIESLRAKVEPLQQEVARLKRQLEDARQRRETQKRKAAERTPTGKRRAVLVALRDPANVAASNREIARRCGVSEGLVRRLRAESSAHGTQIGQQPGEVEVRRGESVYRMRRRANGTPPPIGQ